LRPCGLEVRNFAGALSLPVHMVLFTTSAVDRSSSKPAFAVAKNIMFIASRCCEHENHENFKLSRGSVEGL
jgi:hypothetical protein